MLQQLEFSVKTCSDAVLDSLWAILKYKEIGILRKIYSICEILGLDSKAIIEYLPKSSDERLLDKETRQIIHTILINRSKQQTHEQ